VGLSFDMKKKFDVDKFFKILSKPKKYKRLIKWNYPDEFGLNTKTHFYQLPSFEDALIDAGYKELIKVNDDKNSEITGYDEERYIFSEIDELDKDFKNLDKSLNYSPIFHLRDTPVPDDGLYYKIEELGYLTSKKSKYSFLLWSDDYNSNFSAPDVIKIFKNIKEEEKKTFSNIALEKNISGALGKNTHYCEFVFLNNSYNWGTDIEYKELISKGKFPKSLKKHFLSIVKNKIAKHKEWENKPSDIKKINSLIAIINENRIKKKSFRPFPTLTRKSTKLGKGEVWEFAK
tara:strand:+ start:38 stop:904 length:867 start_codon:yes stop_codon:yes gene_type:complete